MKHLLLNTPLSIIIYLQFRKIVLQQTIYVLSFTLLSQLFIVRIVIRIYKPKIQSQPKLASWNNIEPP